MEAWLAKVMVMALLTCVVFVGGLLPIRLFRSIRLGSVSLRCEYFIISLPSLFIVLASDVI